MGRKKNCALVSPSAVSLELHVLLRKRLLGVGLCTHVCVCVCVCVCICMCMFFTSIVCACAGSTGYGVFLFGLIVSVWATGLRFHGGALSAVRAQCRRSATIWASSCIGDPYFVILGAAMLPLA